jgi:hypothetical protein
MATVLTYWCLPEEEIDFLNYLSKWDIYAYDPTFFLSLSDVKPVPLTTLIVEQKLPDVYFGPKQFLSEKDIGLRTHLNGVAQYGVHSMNAQTIGYRRPCFRVGGELGKSNLHAYWKYPNAAVTGFIEKDPEFIKWAKKVFGWGRKWACERVMHNGYPYAATKRVKQLVEKNELRVGN